MCSATTPRSTTARPCRRYCGLIPVGSCCTSCRSTRRSATRWSGCGGICGRRSRATISVRPWRNCWNGCSPGWRTEPRSRLKIRFIMTTRMGIRGQTLLDRFPLWLELFSAVRELLHEHVWANAHFPLIFRIPAQIEQVCEFPRFFPYMLIHPLSRYGDFLGFLHTCSFCLFLGANEQVW